MELGPVSFSVNDNLFEANQTWMSRIVIQVGKSLNITYLKQKLFKTTFYAIYFNRQSLTCL